MLAKNSSKVTPESKPDHLGTSDIKERSLWTVDVPIDIRSFKSCNSFLVSVNSDKILASAIVKYSKYKVSKTQNFQL